jgi:hypothetical protein
MTADWWSFETQIIECWAMEYAQRAKPHSSVYVRIGADVIVCVQAAAKPNRI